MNWDDLAARFDLRYGPSHRGRAVDVVGSYRHREFNLRVYGTPPRDRDPLRQWLRRPVDEGRLGGQSLVTLNVTNPGLMSFILQDKGDIFNPVRQYVQRLLGETDSQMFERRFDFDVRPEKFTNGLLAVPAMWRARQAALTITSPLIFELRIDKLSLQLPYRVVADEAVFLLDLMSDTAEAVEAVSRVEVLDPRDPRRFRS